MKLKQILKFPARILIFVTLLSLTLISLATPRQNVADYISSGDQFLAEKKHSKAYESYLKAESLDPNNPQVHLKLAHLYEETNNLNLAYEEASKAVALSNNSPQASVELEKIKAVLEEEKKLYENIVYWEKEVLEKPDYRDAWIQLASNYYRIKDFGKAKEAINKALELDPNYEIAKKLKESIP
ncbi:MAG: hypothetical protein A2Y57_02440 [Candidatus Woykebacteria bacterium RBG_13_40_7b]|uniref:Uncharacterized protein n=1 Tax=Candidatus Woykebacteria bacterium RBG_13_40_7b TaxID=1802594 RepID=A0A1G1WBC9_9BACT|nr:MAG: hypothetical protein A2Y57_02440 [Candidatus Woykebacteria bacterium RBG_13_40_7b]